MNARLWRLVLFTREIKEALQTSWFPADLKQWNADGDSGYRDRDRIAAEQNHERSPAGEKIWFH